MTHRYDSYREQFWHRFKDLVRIFWEHTHVVVILDFLKWGESALMKTNAC